MRENDPVVLLLARPQPGLIPERSRARQLGLQVGRHAYRLVVVATSDAHETRLERVVPVLLLERCELVEQLTQRGRNLKVMCETVEGRALLRTGVGARRGHLRLLVPGEEAGCLLEIVDIAKAPAQLVEALGHARESSWS